VNVVLFSIKNYFIVFCIFTGYKKNNRNVMLKCVSQHLLIYGYVEFLRILLQTFSSARLGSNALSANESEQIKKKVFLQKDFFENYQNFIASNDLFLHTSKKSRSILTIKIVIFIFIVFVKHYVCRSGCNVTYMFLS